ncbi:MAG TPA: hypothetical protein VGA37_09320 [Gemmatimonadales bacterium]
MAQVTPRLDLRGLSKRIAGLVVAELTQPSPHSIAVHFEGGAVVVFGRESEGISLELSPSGNERRLPDRRPRPTGRQHEYLDFIKKYMVRFGVAPAEADIERHFLVSAPSVNQMIRRLERRGFIVRDRDWLGHTVPRSIRVLWED